MCSFADRIYRSGIVEHVSIRRRCVEVFGVGLTRDLGEESLAATSGATIDLVPGDRRSSVIGLKPANQRTTRVGERRHHLRCRGDGSFKWIKRGKEPASSRLASYSSVRSSGLSGKCIVTIRAAISPAN